MKIAIIPARGGSQRIPRKNIKMFNGKAAIAYPIEAARASGCFDRVIVSTDDDEIAEVARAHGAEVPFRRPTALADEHTTTITVIQHAIGELSAGAAAPEWVCCIYATALFLAPEDLQRGWETLNEQGSDFAFSVTSYAFPIQRAIRMTRAGRVAMFQPEHMTTRSQDLEPAYHDAGQFYWGRAEAFQVGKPLFSSVSVPIILPRYRVQDIDTPEDWVAAELMHHALAATR
ncbi:pseudaminic acid cytidylyltransferase [Burkholderia sp. AW49-1]